jgi:hypothetical protein
MMRSFFSLGFVVAFIFVFFDMVEYSIIIAALTSILFWMSYILFPPKIDHTASLEDRVKQRLGVEHMKVWFKKKSSNKVAFGGFAIPVLPLFVTAGFNSSLDRVEVLIHELVHAHYFIYGFQTAAMYMVLAMFKYNIVFSFGALIIFMLIQEYITFNKTRSIAEEFGYKTRKWSGITFLKYVIYYGGWILFVMTCILIGVLVSLIAAVVLFLVGAYIFNLAMVKLAKILNKLDYENAEFYR